MPFMIEPMPCSRTPKWIWRPLELVRRDRPARPSSSVPVLPGEVGAAADEAGHDVEDRVEHRRARVAGRDLLARLPRRAASPPSPARPRCSRHASNSSASVGSRCAARRAAAPTPRAPPSPRRRPRGSTRARRRAPRSARRRACPRISLTARDLVARRAGCRARRRCRCTWATASRCGCAGRPGSAARPRPCPRAGPPRARRGRWRPRRAATTCQPYASKRFGTSSVYASSVGPSIVMWLSS